MADAWVVLIVERVVAVADGLVRAFEEAGASVLRAATAGESIQALVDQPVDVVVAALDLPGESGLAVLQHVQGLASERYLPVLILSPDGDAAARVRALSAGADDCLARATPADEVVARAQRCLKVRRRIDALVAERAALRELSITDGLTALANHRYFQERLADEFRRAQRYDDPLSLIILDLDHFKQVNDAHGHQAGDVVLKAVAGSLRRAVRETDFIARYGGEEFAVLLPKTPLAGALTVAERMSAELRRSRPAPSGGLVTASFGVSGFPSRTVHSAEQLVRTADQTLYRAKAEGRNRIALYSASLFPAAATGSA